MLFMCFVLCLPVTATAEETSAPVTTPPKPLAKPVKDIVAIGEMKLALAHDTDTMLDIARRFGLGYIEILIANPNLDPWLPGKDAPVLLPLQNILPDAPHKGIVINLAELRLYYYPPKGGEIVSYPIGIGRDGMNTPTGVTEIRNKKEGPWWFPTARMREEDPSLPEVVKQRPEDNNPLGTHALYLGWPSFAIHGTQEPWGIGRTVSSGCIRMYPEHIPDLFKKIEIGTRVEVVYQPLKAAWFEDGELYLEAHPTRAQALKIDQNEPIRFDMPANFYSWILRKAGPQADRLDWEKILTVLKRRPGYPVQITTDPTRTAKNEEIKPRPVTRRAPAYNN